MSRTPIRTVEELDALDNDEIAEGYMDASDISVEPGDNRSLSYWHGWRNGRVDNGFEQPDEAMAALVRDVMRNGGPLRLSGQTGPDMRREARLARDAADREATLRKWRLARQGWAAP